MATRTSLPVFDEKGKVDTRPLSVLWRSIEERVRGGAEPSKVRAEFALGAATLPEADNGTSRRSFVQLMGASAALAGLAACVRKPREQMLAYTKQPEGVVPGRANHYATASFLAGKATGLLATSFEGRPTKLDGNAQHPASLGGTGPLDQASLLHLYDPQRAGVVKYRGQDKGYHSFLLEQASRAEQMKKDGGQGLRFLMEPSSSPLLGAQRERLRKDYPNAQFVSYSALAAEGWQDASLAAFGAQAEARIDLHEADVIVSLDYDFLAALPGTLALQRQFADRRDPKAGEMNRLYVVEPGMTPTGGSADHRLMARPCEMTAVALGLLGRVARLSKHADLSRFASQNPTLSAPQAKFLDAIAADLVRKAGKSIVLVGDRQPAAVHLAAIAINSALGNIAKTVRYTRSLLHDPDNGPKGLAGLVAEIQAGKVDTLVITAHNPVYSAPADLEFAAALKKVPNSIYLGYYNDETAAGASWFLPLAHDLESWGDGLAADGTVTFQQPLIAPLFNGITEGELLASFFGEAEMGSYGILRASWDSRSGVPTQGNFPGTMLPAPIANAVSTANWEKWIADGFISGTSRAEDVTVNFAQLEKGVPSAATQPTAGIEGYFATDYKVWDGRFGNNVWLQELPDPITKLTWENAALVSPATAQRLGIEPRKEMSESELIDISVGTRTVRAAVFIQPGQTPETVQLILGYGQQSPSQQISFQRGYNATQLRTTAGFWSAGTANIAVVTTEKHELAQTQEHHSMENRALALQTNLEEFEAGKMEDVLANSGPQDTLYKPVVYEGFKWSMAIDLSKCTGCSACVTACQAENNIPVVGKDQVIRSREMHWLRLDRYYIGDENNPEMITQPLMCQQCENAPCEYVCPVNATVHSDEGLNDMVYNRCVGTRYCSNNCPYKVRRFNFFSYTSNYSDTEKMVMNPEVTVRARGVMEKCTYCVQRIERARIDTRVAGTEIKDGDIRTACQDACPSAAIVFGSLHDAESAVSKQSKSSRRYNLLHQLGTRPRTVYLARVKNPNKELA